VAEFAYEPGPEVNLAPGEPAKEISGRSPWRIAGRRFLRDRLSLAALALFIVILIGSLLAPVYAHHVAHTDPFVPNLSGTTEVNGKQVDIIQQGGGGGLGLGEVPIGPTWQSNYFIGADNQGRDVMARVFYGGRASLQIGIVSAVICTLIALALALLAGFFRGWTDSFLSRIMDLIWAFPVYLLAISLSTVLLTKPEGLKWGPITVNPASLWVPTTIIALVYVPYVYRPIRGQVLAVREKEYIEAATSQGASNLRLMFSDILPNVLPTAIVLLPLMIATTILTESALSFLSIGVQPPNASWGTVIQDGQDLLYTRPLVSIVPGVMIVLTVLAMNVLGDGVRDALDPRAKVRTRE
jgi:peptide/nickel transport system permease protein